MSEALPSPKPPRIDLDDVAANIALSENSLHVYTHARFSVSSENSLDVALRQTETGRLKRLLIAEEDQSTRDVYDKLQEAGIPQFDREVFSNDLVVYSLPQQVKPLSHENFFVELKSSETYVSDSELFHHLGLLWGTIQRITDKIPNDPLDATAVQNFEESLLAPVPPYDSWLEAADRDQAQTDFTNSIRDALLRSNPHKSYTPLIESLKAGWHESGQ